MEPIRIAYLINSVGLGGGELLLVNQLTYGDRATFDPLVVCTGEGPLPERLRAFKVPVFILPLHRGAKIREGRLVPTPSTLWRLVRLLREEDVRLIHSYTLETRNYAHAAAVLSGRPLIHTSQDFWFGGMFNRLDWWLMNHIPARILVVSETTRQSLHVGTDLNPGRVVLIRPGVDLARFIPRNEREAAKGEFGLRPRTSLVGIVGRFSRVKGFDTFFAAAARVAQRIPDVRFVVVGGAVLRDDDYSEEISWRISRYELERRVLLTGFREDVPLLMNAMDVVVSASPREAAPLVLMEAAACGRPVVATRSGGAEEIVVDGKTGFLVPVGDARAMADAITTLLSDLERADAMGRAARWHAETHFGLTRMIKQIESVYRSVLRDPHQRPVGARDLVTGYESAEKDERRICRLG